MPANSFFSSKVSFLFSVFKEKLDVKFNIDSREKVNEYLIKYYLLPIVRKASVLDEKADLASFVQNSKPWFIMTNHFISFATDEKTRLEAFNKYSSNNVIMKMKFPWEDDTSCYKNTLNSSTINEENFEIISRNMDNYIRNTFPGYKRTDSRSKMIMNSERILELRNKKELEMLNLLKTGNWEEIFKSTNGCISAHIIKKSCATKIVAVINCDFPVAYSCIRENYERRDQNVKEYREICKYDNHLDIAYLTQSSGLFLPREWIISRWESVNSRCAQILSYSINHESMFPDQKCVRGHMSGSMFLIEEVTKGMVKITIVNQCDMRGDSDSISSLSSNAAKSLSKVFTNLKCNLESKIETEETCN
jgi:hypothetical protein